MHAGPVPAPPSSRPAQVVGLDVLRLVAALLVAVYHLTYLVWANPHDHGHADAALFLVYAAWRPFVDTGWVGVQMFFVISGFVIAYTANGRSPSTFVRSRILRLMPGVWACATLSVAIALATGTPPGRAALLYALSVTIFPTGPWLAASYWTLPIEIAFYTLIFLLLCRDRFHHLETLVLVLGGASLLLWLALLWAPPGPLGHAVEAFAHHRVSRQLLLQHGCFFALGSMIWIVRERGAGPARLAALAVLVSACLLEIDDETRNAAAWAGLPMSRATASAIFLGFLILVAAALRWNAALHARLGRRVMAVRALGLTTYPVYLLHQPIGLPLGAWQIRHAVPPAIALILSLALILLLSWIVAMRIEPALRARIAPRLERLDGTLLARWSWAVRPTRRLPAARPVPLR